MGALPPVAGRLFLIVFDKTNKDEWLKQIVNHVYGLQCASDCNIIYFTANRDYFICCSKLQQIWWSFYKINSSCKQYIFSAMPVKTVSKFIFLLREPKGVFPLLFCNIKSYNQQMWSEVVMLITTFMTLSIYQQDIEYFICLETCDVIAIKSLKINLNLKSWTGFIIRCEESAGTGVIWTVGKVKWKRLCG